MGIDFDFKGFGAEGSGADNGTHQLEFHLPRQLSIYSMTFDEFQGSVEGIGKDFGSMNMDEFLKNIWSGEENNNFGSTSATSGDKDGTTARTGTETGTGYLQRQGSLTLPRTLSQKTVDEVWCDISKDFGVAKDGNSGVGMNFAQTQKQPTLGEVTLEEFLVRAGVVREEVHAAPPRPNPIGFTGSRYMYQHQQGGLMGGLASESGNSPSLQSANLELDSKGARRQPKQALASTIRVPSKNHHLDIPDQTVHKTMLQNNRLAGGGLGVVGLGADGVSIAVGSPVVSPSNGEPSSSVSPRPYSFNGSLSGRKSPALEKMVERRQKRMIKNRESAARSRARKQAYTMELEGEVAKLKEEIENMRKKQAELVEMHKNQILELMSHEPAEGEQEKTPEED